MFQFSVLSFALLVFLYSSWGCLGVNFQGDVGELFYVLFAFLVFVFSFVGVGRSEYSFDHFAYCQE